MEKYIVTIFSLFFSAFLFAVEPATKTDIEKNRQVSGHSSDINISCMDSSTLPGYNPEVIQLDLKEFDQIKGEKYMPDDSVKKIPVFRKRPKYHARDDILRYKVDPDVDANMPRMPLDPNIDAKILKIYPHIGVGLLGNDKKAFLKHRKFHFKE